MDRRIFLAAAAVVAATAVLPRLDICGTVCAKAISLADRWPEGRLDGILIGREQWRPFARVSQRGPWESLDNDIRSELLERAEEYAGYEWPGLPATVFLEYVRTGNRSNYQDLSFGRRRALAALVMGECLEGKGRFLDDIVNGVWAICEETYWGVPAHVGVQKAGSGLPDVEEPTVDLFAGETAGLLAWTYYLLGEKLDSVSPLVRARIEYEVKRRVLGPCLERDDFWWMGFGSRGVNNWNPWCNSNWLLAVLLVEGDAGRRKAGVAKVMRSLDKFIGSYPADGGCNEGPGYWKRAAGSLFDCLELLRSATGGEIDVYDEPIIGEMGRYIYRVHVGARWMVNFADASVRASVPSQLVFRYGQRIGDEKMSDFGAYMGRITGAGAVPRDSVGRQLFAAFEAEGFVKAMVEAEAPMPRDVWLGDTQVMVARDEGGNSKGLFVAAKGGHNAESHNHNDVGSFVAYLDGRPVVIDAGVGEYTSKTFSSRRYEIWTMQSAYHNLPRINGVMQRAGSEYRARNVKYAADDSSASLSLDIGGAYPEEAKVKTWRRTVELVRGERVQIRDAYELAEEPGEIKLSLMVARPAEVKAAGEIVLAGEGGGRDAVIRYDADKLSADVETIELEDRSLRSDWGERIGRIVLGVTEPGQRGELVVTIGPRQGGAGN